MKIHLDSEDYIDVASAASTWRTRRAVEEQGTDSAISFICRHDCVVISAPTFRLLDRCNLDPRALLLTEREKSSGEP